MELRPYQTALIEDLRQAYRNGYRRPCLVLPCGGGKSVIAAEIARSATAKGNRVLFIVHRKELVQQIKETFAVWNVNMDLCHVGMVQTVCRRLDKTDKPRLIITDENHHCPAASYRKIYDAFPDAQCLGFTATPIRLNGGGLGDINDALVEGVSAKWLIAHKYLAPYDYFGPSVADLSGVRIRRGEYVAEDIADVLGRPAIFGDVIHHYRKLADGKKAICYCAIISHSKAMAKRFTEAGIPAAHIDGNTDTQTRANTIEAFRRGDIRILCNVDLISEGFDVPDCAVAILLRPTQSLTLFIQQSMRCMRWQEGKRATIIDHVRNYARFGLPDDDRRWSLEPKRKKKMTANGLIQCRECLFTFRPERGKPAICPKCGCVNTLLALSDDNGGGGRQTPDEVPDAELHQIKTGFTLDFQTPNDCKSYKELLEYAKRHGYKRGWAWYQAKAKGWFA